MDQDELECRRKLFHYVKGYDDLQSVWLPTLLDDFTARPGGIYNLPVVSNALLGMLKDEQLTLTPARYLKPGPKAERFT